MSQFKEALAAGKKICFHTVQDGWSYHDNLKAALEEQDSRGIRSVLYDMSGRKISDWLVARTLEDIE